MNTAKDNVSKINSRTSILSLNHIVICIAVLVLAFIVITVFKITPGTLLLTGMFIACPLLHIFMMRNHKH